MLRVYVNPIHWPAPALPGVKQFPWSGYSSPAEVTYGLSPGRAAFHARPRLWYDVSHISLGVLARWCQNSVGDAPPPPHLTSAGPSWARPRVLRNLAGHVSLAKQIQG